MANQTVTVLEADGITETAVEVLGFGRQAAEASKSVAASTEDKAVLDAMAASLALLDNAIASGNELQVDVVASLPAGTNNIGDVDVLSLPALPAGSNLIGSVDLGATDNAVLDAIAASLAALETVTIKDSAADGADMGFVVHIHPDSVNANGQTTMSASAPVVIASDQSSIPVVGNVAHDAADSGNPVKVGGKATSSEPAAVADADRSNLITDLVGKLITAPYAANQQFISGATSVITDTTSTSVIAAQGAGVRTYVTSLLVTNSDASVGTAVAITDGSGGTVLWRGYAAPAGGGFSVSFPVPLRTTANTALHAVCATTSAEVYVSAAGYKGA